MTLNGIDFTMENVDALSCHIDKNLSDHRQTSTVLSCPVLTGARFYRPIESAGR